MSKCFGISGYHKKGCSVSQLYSFLNTKALAILDELDSEYGDLADFSDNRWLSCTANLKRFQDSKRENQHFTKKKEQNVIFFDKRFLIDLTFLVDNIFVTLKSF